MFHETFPGEPMTVLADYFAREVSDSLDVCRRVPDLAAQGMPSVRLDTTVGRYVDGLDPATSYAVLEPTRRSRSRLSQRRKAALPRQDRHVGGGDLPSSSRTRCRGFHGDEKIVASSGFGRPSAASWRGQGADRRGEGGPFLPSNWSETYATADIVEYDGKPE